MIALILGVFIGSFLFTLLNYFPAKKDIVFGATFSKKYAEELGIDWQKAYLGILDDLKVKALRLPVYWDDAERETGKYDFSAYDWMVNEAEKRNVKIILAVGIKLPRWPECHIPWWVKLDDPAKIEDSFIPFLRDAVERYKTSPLISAFQVENEPYFFREFGVCPLLPQNFLDKEVDLVKKISGRPVILTESGELGHWERLIGKADILGVSLYRVTWNRWVGYFFYPLTPVFYREKIRVLKPFFEDILITELQVEPWTNKSISQTPLEEQFKTMNLRQLKNNVDFVKYVGANEVYLWGVEWWYWMKEKNGDGRFWEEGKKMFQ